MKNKKILYAIIGVVAVLAIIIGIGVHKNNSKPENAFSNTTWKIKGDKMPYWKFGNYDPKASKDTTTDTNKFMYSLDDTEYKSDASFLEEWNRNAYAKYYVVVGNTIYIYRSEDDYRPDVNNDKNYNEKHAYTKFVLKKKGNNYVVTEYAHRGTDWDALRKNVEMNKVGKAVQN